jgi:phosphate butyryltransferase
MNALDARQNAEHCELVENRTFDEIRIGESASVTRQVTRRDVDLLAIVSGDVNPLHFDEEFARHTPVHKVVAHGLFGDALISAVISSKLPGPGAVLLGMKQNYLLPVGIGDTLTATVTVTAKRDEKGDVTLDCACFNQAGLLAISGQAEVRAPREKISVPLPDLPGVQVANHVRFHQLMAQARNAVPLSLAVAHPCDGPSLIGAVEAAQAGLISPILVGPQAKIRAVAKEAGIDIDAYRIADAPHSAAAAALAVELVRRGEADALMKGSLHSDELLHAVLDKTAGLRTGRRLSHVFVMDAPSYPRPLLITDAAVNIAPDLDTKKDIIQNAIELAHALGTPLPRVAILAAVEMVNPNMPSTLDAAALCKMADRGQITGGLVDGPLAFDNAVSMAAAKEKGIVSPVAGQADILVAPDLESGNMLAKQLSFLAGADAAGVVLGARAPIILTSRADSVRTRLASCAIACILARAKAKGPAAL